MPEIQKDKILAVFQLACLRISQLRNRQVGFKSGKCERIRPAVKLEFLDFVLIVLASAAVTSSAGASGTFRAPFGSGGCCTV